MKIKINSKLTYRCTVSQIEGYIVITLVLKDYSNYIKRSSRLLHAYSKGYPTQKSDSRLPRNFTNNCIAMLEYTYISLINYFNTTSMKVQSNSITK